MNEVFSPVYTLFMNAYLVALDLIILVILCHYLSNTIRANPKGIQIPFVIAFTVYLGGNAISRAWVTLYRWLVAHGYETQWMLGIPVLPLGLFIVSIGLAGITGAIIGARFGFVSGIIAIALALAFGFVASQ